MLQHDRQPWTDQFRCTERRHDGEVVGGVIGNHHLQTRPLQPLPDGLGCLIRAVQPIAVVFPTHVDGAVAHPLHHPQPQREGEVERVPAEAPERQRVDGQQAEPEQAERVAEQRRDDHERAESAERQRE